VGWRAVPAKEYKRLREAREYEYYWYKAAKRVDIREIDGFGLLAARAIDEHRTGMKYDRLYTLWQAVAQLTNSTDPILEIGAFRGGSAHFVASALRWHGRANPFFVCDTFHGHAVVDDDADSVHRVGEQFVNTSLEEVAAYLAPFPNVRLIQGDFRGTSGQLVGAGPFPLVHLDVDVYPVTAHALEFIAPRMLRGGWIVVDDYGFTTCPGAKKAVDEFAAAHPEFTAMHLLTGQAVLIRVTGQ
jgi:O-methyltransferase